MHPSESAVTGAFVIRDLASLNRFEAERRGFPRSGAPAVEVACPGLRERERVERALNGALRACGCLEGGMAALAAVAVAVAGHVVGRPVTGSSVAAEMALTFAAALAGKLLGLARGRWVRSRALGRIRRALEAENHDRR